MGLHLNVKTLLTYFLHSGTNHQKNTHTHTHIYTSTWEDKKTEAVKPKKDENRAITGSVGFVGLFIFLGSLRPLYTFCSFATIGVVRSLTGP